MWGSSAWFRLVSFPVRFCELLREPEGSRGQKCGAWGLAHALGPCPPPADCAPTQDPRAGRVGPRDYTHTRHVHTHTHACFYHCSPLTPLHPHSIFLKRSRSPRMSGPLHMLFFRPGTPPLSAPTPSSPDSDQALPPSGGGFFWDHPTSDQATPPDVPRSLSLDLLFLRHIPISSLPYALLPNLLLVSFPDTSLP